MIKNNDNANDKSAKPETKAVDDKKVAGPEQAAAAPDAATTAQAETKKS